MKTIAQDGLFDESSRHARFLELLIRKDGSTNKIKEALKKILSYAESVEGLYIQLSFGSSCWNVFNPSWQPKELVSFSNLAANGLAMPSTQADILIWIHSSDSELIPEAVITTYQLLNDVVDIQLDIEGIKNKQSRDLIGFVDGTANAKEDKRLPIALIPDNEIGAGGSYVLSQRWQHNLPSFNRLTIPQQEKVVGRTKVEDVELEGEDMPVDSHVSRTDAKVDGVGMKIYRRSYPYMASQLSTTPECETEALPNNGLYFFAFACEMQRFTVQLERMIGLTKDGVSDKLMNYSEAKMSSYWFMPNKNDLMSALV